jgi:hypothetical protein
MAGKGVFERVGKPKQVILVIECKVTKEVVCEGCTVEQARNDPWEYAVDEREIDQIDWEVKSAKGED